MNAGLGSQSSPHVVMFCSRHVLTTRQQTLVELRLRLGLQNLYITQLITKPGKSPQRSTHPRVLDKKKVLNIKPSLGETRESMEDKRSGVGSGWWPRAILTQEASTGSLHLSIGRSRVTFSLLTLKAPSFMLKGGKCLAAFPDGRSCSY